MSIRFRIARTVAVLAIAGTSTLALAPAVHAAQPGPNDVTNPVQCTHACIGGIDPGPGDLTDRPRTPDPKPDPKPDPQPEPQPQSDTPVVVSHPTFTG